MDKLIWKLSLLVLVVLVVLPLSSCYTKKQAMRKFGSKSETSDSSRSKITTNSSTNLKDSSIVSPPTKLEVNLNPCDSLGRVIENLNLELSAGIGKLTIKSDAGRILIKANCDSIINRYRFELHQRDSALESIQSRKEVIQLPPEVIEVRPWWLRPLLIVLGLLSIPTILKILKILLW